MKIPFPEEYRKKYYSLLNEVFDSGFLSEGKMLRNFEDRFTEFTGIPSIAVCNGGAALLALYEYAGVRGHEVIVPANTFYATTAAAIRAGAKVVYADCSRDDLCVSLEDIKKKVTPETRAVAVVHIGGHIAFEINEIAEFCEKNGIYLIEDCAHAHGAEWNGRAAGSWGLGGAYSFYATKTMPLGDGGMVCSSSDDFLDWLKYFRNYGKHVESGRVSYRINDGFNFRMNEVTAAFGLVQMERLPRILEWKRELAAKFDSIFDKRVVMPEGMTSGYYKYIVFDSELRQETGKVFNKSDFGNVIQGVDADIPNSLWVAEHHSCAPIWFGWESARETPEKLKEILLG